MLMLLKTALLKSFFVRQEYVEQRAHLAYTFKDGLYTRRLPRCEHRRDERKNSVRQQSKLKKKGTFGACSV